MVRHRRNPPAENPAAYSYSLLQIPQVPVPEEPKPKRLGAPTKVEQIRKGVVIATHQSLQAASSCSGIELGSISAACNGGYSRPEVGGYSWRFAHPPVRPITVQQVDRTVLEQAQLSPKCPVLSSVHPAASSALTAGAPLARVSVSQDNSRLDALIGTTCEACSST